MMNRAIIYSTKAACIERYFRTWDGEQLFYRAWVPAESVNRAIVLVHRGHEHSRRLHELVEAVAAPASPRHGSTTMLDGMVAELRAQPNPLGGVYNELSDHLADVVILVSAGYAPGSSIELGYIVALLALTTADLRRGTRFRPLLLWSVCQGTSHVHPDCRTAVRRTGAEFNPIHGRRLRHSDDRHGSARTGNPDNGSPANCICRVTSERMKGTGTLPRLKHEAPGQ